MSEQIRRFWIDEKGQDLTEYTLLVAAVAMVCMWFLGVESQSVNRIWTSANSTVVNAQIAANGGD